MNNLFFHTSNPSGRLFSGWYRPLLIASALADSDGHAYETSFQWNFSSNFAAKLVVMHAISDSTNKNFMKSIFVLRTSSTSISHVHFSNKNVE